MAISCFIVLPLIILSISLVNKLEKNTFWTNWRASLLAWSGIFSILFLIQLVLPTSNTTYYEYIILLFPIWIHVIILFDAAKREPYKNDLKVAVILLFILLHLLVLGVSYFQPRSIVRTFSDDYRSNFADSDYEAEGQKQSDERTRVPKAELAETQQMSEKETIEGQSSDQYKGLLPVEQIFFKRFVPQVDNVLNGEDGNNFVEGNLNRIAELIRGDENVKIGLQKFYTKKLEESKQTTITPTQYNEILKNYLRQAPLEFKYRLYTEFFERKPNS